MFSGMAGDSKWPVIVNSSLKLRGICKHFDQKGHFKVRVSGSTLPDTCIFPKSSVAFLLLDEKELAREETFKRIQKFAQIHGNSHTLCIQTGGILNPRIYGLLSTIQTRLLPSCCYFNVVDSAEAAIDIMTDVAKLQMELIGQSLVQQVEKMQASHVSEDTVKGILNALPMAAQESTLVLDRCGSLGQLANASEELFLDGGLDTPTARKLHDFFKTDKYHI